jgi:4-aminobutyrate aminotransferase/(S)-3-amino-2-methylpropionate transaminase
MDVPQFDWPTAPYPKLKYPLDAYAAENRKEEDRCLEETAKLVKGGKYEIAGIMIEPV